MAQDTFLTDYSQSNLVNLNNFATIICKIWKQPSLIFFLHHIKSRLYKWKSLSGTQLLLDFCWKVYFKVDFTRVWVGQIRPWLDSTTTRSGFEALSQALLHSLFSVENNFFCEVCNLKVQFMMVNWNQCPTIQQFSWCSMLKRNGARKFWLISLGVRNVAVQIANTVATFYWTILQRVLQQQHKNGFLPVLLKVDGIDELDNGSKIRCKTILKL